MSIDRTSSLHRLLCLVSAASTCLAACAGGTRSAPPAQEPAVAAAPSRSDSGGARAAQKSGGASPAEASAAEMAAPRAQLDHAPPAAPPFDDARNAAPSAGDPHSPVAGARTRLVEARRELDIATNERDCARACRALESMERAAQQVCELARLPEERSECASAAAQVDKARDRVRSACGPCPRKPR